MLTGTGLAASAGLNAYIPLLLMGLLSRYTDLIQLPQSWAWLSNGWVLIILGTLLAIEVVADKIPIVDSINDVVQTVIRPTSGGLAFGAASTSETATVQDPASFFDTNQWVPIAAGVVIALVVHGAKALSRPVVNAASVGVAAPVVSTGEDFASVAVSLVAIVVPILVLVCLVGLILGMWWLLRRRRGRIGGATA